METGRNNQNKTAIFKNNDRNKLTKKSTDHYCNWETKFGCCAAVSLSVLEIKRFALLTLEMLTDSKPIRFAGALVPVLLSFCDAGLGFPVAIATVYAIKKLFLKSPSYLIIYLND